MPLPATVKTHTVERRYLLPMDTSDLSFVSLMLELFLHAHLGICSPMDTGKSHAYIAYIRWVLEKYPTIRILLVTSRITLAEQLRKRLENEGVKCVSYRDDQVKRDPSLLATSSCVIIQLDSLGLHKTLQNCFDVILLDESESTLKHFKAKTMGDRPRVWRVFQDLSTRCSQLLLLDAFLSCRSHWWLDEMYQASTSTQASPDAASLTKDGHGFRERLNKDGVHILVNTIKTDEKKYISHAKKETFYLVLCDLLLNRKKVAIACNSKRICKKLYQDLLKDFPHLKDKIRIYHSEVDAEHRGEIGNCNEEWLKFDVILYSPTVGAGVDFNPPEPHFDVVMAYGVLKSNPCSDFMQMIGRIRKVKDNTVHVFLQNFNSRIPYVHRNEEYIIADLQNSENILDLKDPPLWTDRRYRQLHIYNTWEEEQSNDMFAHLFWKAVADKGGERAFFSSSSIPETEKKEQTEEKKEKNNKKRWFEKPRDKAIEMEAAQLVDAKFANLFAETDSIARISKNKQTEHDILLIRQKDLIHGFGLTKIKPSEKYVDDAQRNLMIGFVYHMIQDRQKDQFSEFCRINSSLQYWLDEWRRKARLFKRELLEEMPERGAYQRCRLTRGVMFIAGFDEDDYVESSSSSSSLAPTPPMHGHALSRDVSSASSSTNNSTSSDLVNNHRHTNVPQLANDTDPPASVRKPPSRKRGRPSGLSREPSLEYPEPASTSINEEAGSICSTKVTNTSIIQDRLTNKGGNKWLRDNAKWINGCLKTSLEELETYKPGHVIRLARKMLHQAGCDLEDGGPQQRLRRPGSQSRPTISSWRISSHSFSMSAMLEIAYGLYIDQSKWISVYRQHLGDWNVTKTLHKWRPEFRWTALTGTYPPYSPVVPDAQSSDGEADMLDQTDIVDTTE